MAEKVFEGGMFHVKSHVYDVEMARYEIKTRDKTLSLYFCIIVRFTRIYFNDF